MSAAARHNLAIAFGILLAIVAGRTPASYGQNFWCGFGCSSSDWNAAQNWDFQTTPTGNETALIDGAFDPRFAGGAGVDAVGTVAQFGSLQLNSGATVNLGAGTSMVVEKALVQGESTLNFSGDSSLLIEEGFDRILVGSAAGEGVLNMTDDSSFEMTTPNGLWVGRQQGGPGTVNLSGNAQLRHTDGREIVFAVFEPAILNISENALIEAGEILIARNAGNLGGESVTFQQTGGTVRTPELVFGSGINATFASMSGGLIDAGEFTWNAPEGATFDFSGGEILIDGDQTALINEPWFNASVPVAAFFDGTRTTIMVSSGPPSDFNGDGTVDGDDLKIWESGFGTTSGASKSDGDADGDGGVTGNDLIIWQQEVTPPGITAGTGAIPEPSTALLLAIGALGSLRLRRFDK